MIAEMLIGVKKNLSKLSARFAVCLAFRLRCDISFEASLVFSQIQFCALVFSSGC